MSGSVRCAATLWTALALAVTLAACGNGDPADQPDAGDGQTTACQTKDDCGQHELCNGGVCVDNSCGNDKPCPSGFVCDQLHGECAPEATDGGPTTDGGSTTTPDGGTAGAACATKYDCKDAEICKNGKCQTPAAGSTCRNDAQCPQGKICNFSGQCEAGCSDPRDCATPLLCHPQKFTCEKCSLTNPCPKSADGKAQSCVAGECKAAVACTGPNATDCVHAGLDGAVCVNGFCSNCSSHADCRVDPYKGNTASTQRICTQDGLCKVSSCTDQNCQQQNGNSPLWHCDTSANACAKYECLADSDCSGGAKCDLTSHTCSTGGSSCDVAACQSGCAAQTDPFTGQPETCNQATCQCDGAGGGAGGGMCATDADCPTGQTCALGICSEAPVNSSGQPCQMADCLGGLFGSGGCTLPSSGQQCEPLMCTLSSALFGSVMCF